MSNGHHGPTEKGGPRFGRGFPKAPKAKVCRKCKGVFQDNETPKRIGGHNYHKDCR